MIMKADDDMPCAQARAQQVKEFFGAFLRHMAVKAAVHHRVDAACAQQRSLLMDIRQDILLARAQHAGGRHVKGIRAGDQPLLPGGLHGLPCQHLMPQMHPVEGAQAHGGILRKRRQVF